VNILEAKNIKKNFGGVAALSAQALLAGKAGLQGFWVQTVPGKAHFRRL
jgi:hypothetical protein